MVSEGLPFYFDTLLRQATCNAGDDTVFFSKFSWVLRWHTVHLLKLMCFCKHPSSTFLWLYVTQRIHTSHELYLYFFKGKWRETRQPTCQRPNDMLQCSELLSPRQGWDVLATVTHQRAIFTYESDRVPSCKFSWAAAPAFFYNVKLLTVIQPCFLGSAYSNHFPISGILWCAKSCVTIMGYAFTATLKGSFFSDKKRYAHKEQLLKQ